MTTYTEDELRLAREIANDLDYESSYERHAAYKGALAAIRETTERATQWLAGQGAGVFFDGVRNGYHLK